uniref:protein-histidine N-methyltransferase n=1 Tax=Strongyloides venezuelensis TaxID=75913 RepID=A0A0K0G1R5_STRVS
MPETLECNDKIIKYLSSEEVSNLIKESNYKNSNELKDIDKSDLIPNIYEGGLKVWEAAIDMCKYITKNGNDTFKGKTVLELGCGAGLPGICALIFQSSHVYFQDFNEVVLKCYTQENVKMNGFNGNQTTYISGDWKYFNDNVRENGTKFDIILTTETIYCEENYEKLYQVFCDNLKDTPDAYILLGGKLYYFGVGGSILGFMDFLKIKDNFNVEVVDVVEASVPRWLLKITRKS